MPQLIEGALTAPKGRLAIVAARFNELVVDRLLQGALETLRRHGVSDDAIDVVRVPGSFEIPLVAQRLAASRRYAAIIALGAIIRGETDHYNYVASEAARIGQAALTTGVPIIFGVLTCDTVEQALNRAGLKAGNKGSESAVTAIEMANLIARIDTQ